MRDQPLHEQMLAIVADERARLASRRRFLVGGAKVAGGGALALAVAAIPASRAVRLAAAQTFADDLDILNYALTLELLESAFYRGGLEQFDDATFTSRGDATPTDGGGPPRPSRQRFQEIADHEAAHVNALTDTITNLGGTPVTEGEYDFGYTDLVGFLDVAQALENTGVAAYAGAAPFIADDGILAAALGIHSVEARHAAYLNLLNDESPFPDAVDVAQTREEVLAVAGDFIVGADSVPAGATALPAEEPVAVEEPTAAPVVDEPVVEEPTAVPAAEVPVDGTVDTDGDGLTDEQEAAYGSDPTLLDTDADNLDDFQERELGTGFAVPDTDGDGVLDGDEVLAGTNPFDPAS